MTAKIGTDRLIVVASAIGSRIIAPKLHAMPVRPISIRRACAPIRRVFSDGRPLVAITHAGFHGDGDEAARQAIDSMGGFSLVLAGLKALLEHGVLLNLVADRHPDAVVSR